MVLPPGAGSQVQDALARLGIEQFRRRHGGWVLQVVQSGQVIGMLAGFDYFLLLSPAGEAGNEKAESHQATLSPRGKGEIF